jgi:MFS family permease
LQIISVLFFAGMVPVAGWLADTYGRRSVLLIVTAAIILFGFSFHAFLNPVTMGTGEGANTGLMLLFLCVGMTLMGLTFGPMSAVLPELFPTNVRYTGSGISYNVSSILGAALTPFVAVWLARNHGVGSVGIYLAVLGALTFIALCFFRETRHKSLDSFEVKKSTVGIETTSP